MTYAQLRRHLSEIAACGDGGAPHTRYPVGRWLELRASGTVTYDEDAARWTLTRQGKITLDRWADRGHASPARPKHHDVRKLA